MNKPLVSVCVVTYNQENYVAQCLDSIVNQQVDFDFEVIIFDDASTDKTSDIINNFAESYSFIKANLRCVNVGAYKNFKECHQFASGKYVCHCDGDDYWLPNKLMQQVSYMESHRNCQISWHRVNLQEADGLFRKDNLTNEILQKRFYAEDLAALGTVAVHSSKMYRKMDDDVFSNGIPIIDYAVNLAQLGDGYAKIIGGAPLGVYRLGLGISSDGSNTKKLYVDTYTYFGEVKPALKKYFVVNATVKLVAAIKNKRRRDIAIFTPHVLSRYIVFSFFYILRNIKIIKAASLK